MVNPALGGRDRVEGRRDRSRIGLLCAVVALLVCGAIHVATHDVGLNPADEGFLWYGVERTAAGEIPIRDFQAYDPGRYYWGAAGALVLGPGILSLRLSLAIFQALGLWCGLLVASRVARAWLLPAVAILLALWMLPRHKVFESSLAMMTVWVAVRLLEDERLGRTRTCFLAGVFVGVAALFGRNHGVYAGLALLAILTLRSLRWGGGRLATPASTLAAGTLVGYAPMLLLCLFAPGFARRFVESVALQLSAGSNLPKAAPWPWTASYGSLDPISALEALATGSAFVVALLVLAAGLATALATPVERVSRRRVWIAATLVGIAYAHHASVRSDLWHLAQCIHPVLLALIALPASFAWRRPTAPALSVALVLAFVTVAAPTNNPAYALWWRGGRASHVSYAAAGDALQVPAAKAATWTRLEQLVRTHVRPGELIYIAPDIPTLYPLLGRRAPVREIYTTRPLPPARQDEMADELDRKGVRFALVRQQREPQPADRSPRFSETHDRLWRHLNARFERVREPAHPQSYWLLRRIESLPGY